MKKIFTTTAILLFTTIGFSANLWWNSPEKQIAIPGDQKLTPENYLLTKLDVTSFNLFQSQIPTEHEGNFPTVQIPRPDGTMGEYFIYENETMAPGLSARYPSIKTYTIIDITNPFITGKVDFTVWGFHAKVFDGAETYFVDPYKQGNTEWYLVYYKKDYHINLNQRMQCLVDDELEEMHEIQSGGLSQNVDLPKLNGLRKTAGTERRTYRLALATTMEYSGAVGGATPTKASVLSAMVTTMNRVNGVFEREFAMTAQLIANTDDVIYLPGGTDPYTNGSGSTMLGENHNTLTSVIGSTNYDFGHVFSTGGGGIAIRASVCRNSKARGVTGRNNPVGDPFDIDYVSHEMGHQFGGNHTFNSASGSCSGNGSSNSSYEPGSGTTIMAYAGICGSTDNIQANSNDYYHIRSLMQIVSHIEGQGNCATKVNTNNTPPNVSSISNSYNIPYKTFFELEGNATDTDNDPISYCWEEWDLGSYGPWNTVSTGNPLFRSFSPQPSGTRVFPIVAKVYTEQIKTKGEVLPEVARNVSFKLAARDIKNGYGSFNYTDDELEIQAVNTGNNLFRVTSHGSLGQMWTGDTKQTVTWNTAGTESGTVNTPTVDIYLSLDKGVTWPYLLVSNVANNGSHSVGVPNVATTNGLIKVKGHNNIFFDLNNAYITIVPQPYPLSLSEVDADIISIYPNPANGYIQLENLPQNVTHFEIINPLGAVVRSYPTATERLQVSDLSNGLYYLSIFTNNGKIGTKKFIIKR